MKEAYEVWIIERLESWAETFNNGHLEYEIEALEDDEEAYNYIHHLIMKFENGTFKKEDYEEILFHLWQRDFSDSDISTSMILFENSI